MTTPSAAIVHARKAAMALGHSGYWGSNVHGAYYGFGAQRAYMQGGGGSTGRSLARIVGKLNYPSDYGKLTSQERRLVKRYWGRLSPSQQRKYTASKGTYTIQKAAKAVITHTPLGFGLLAAEKIAKKGKELKEDIAEFRLPIQKIKEVPRLKKAVEAGEWVGMKGKTWVSEGVKQREVATQIATTGFGVGGGQSYAQREAAIEADLGLTTRTLGQYTQTVSDLAKSDAVKTYYETPQPLKPKASDWKARYESERKRGIERGWITEKGELKGTSYAARKFQGDLHAIWQEGQKYLTPEGYFKEEVFGEKVKPEVVQRFEREMEHITRYETKHGEGAFEKHLTVFSRKAEVVTQLSAFAMRSEVPPTEPSGIWGEAPSKFSVKAWKQPYGYTKPLYEWGLGLGKAYQERIEGTKWYKTPPTAGTPYAQGWGEYWRGFVAKAPPMLVGFGTMIPSAVEAMGREAGKMKEAFIPGAIFMAHGMGRELYKSPAGFTGMMMGAYAITKGAGAVSPLKPVSLRVPTGKGIIKTTYTVGKRLPREFRQFKEIAPYKAPLEMGKIETTRIPGIYRQTHLYPEMQIYKGMYFRTPSIHPYKGTHPLFGITTRNIPHGGMKPSVGMPMFEVSGRYRTFTGVEAAYTLPSVKATFGEYQASLWEASFLLRERLGGRTGIVKPLHLDVVERLPSELRKPTAKVLRKYRRHELFYGSFVKEAQMVRMAGERGGIKPGDIDIELHSLAARMAEGMILPKSWQSAYALSRMGIPSLKKTMIKRMGERMPGITPERFAKELAAEYRKAMPKEDFAIEFKPMWGQYAIKRRIGWEKTELGREPKYETIFDISPEGAAFEFGLRPHRPVRTTLETGLGTESWWRRHQKYKMATLGEEFERGFGSIMQAELRHGEMMILPKWYRMKDIARYIQVGKGLSGLGKLKIETGLGIARRYRLKGVAKEEAALKLWQEYALELSKTEKDLAAYRADILAEAIPAGAVGILTKKIRAESLWLSERAAMFGEPKIRFEELYKPEIYKRAPLPTHEYGGYPAKHDVSLYYGKERGYPSYYQRRDYGYYPPQARYPLIGLSKKAIVPFVSPMPSPTPPSPVTFPGGAIKPTPKRVVGVPTPTPIYAPVTPPPIPIPITSIFAPTPPPTPPPITIPTPTPILDTPPPPPPTTTPPPVPTPTPRPPPPPPPFFIGTPPPPPPPFIPFAWGDEEKKKKKKLRKKKQWEWLEEFTVQRPEELHFGAIESGIPKVSKVTMLPQITMADITPKPRKAKSLKGKKTNRGVKKKKK